ncbi:DUF3971 domain-containing protein [Sulfitobacter brevis]|nr:DUF3971 domain-containing protein [Sulfitobacter brevis]
MTQIPPRSSAPPRRRRLRRAGMWLLAVVLVLSTATAGGIIYLTGRPITTPEWLQQRIETRIAEALPQVRVQFGEMTLVVDKGWRPRVRLRDVAVNAASGAEIVRFNELKASFAMRPLLDGLVQPRDIALSGVFVTLRRGTNGRVSLTAGTGTAAPASEAASIPQLIGQVDRLLATPALSALARAEIRALTIRYEDARSKRAWTIDGGRLLLAREGDDLTIGADLAVLSGGAEAATLSANYTSRIGEHAAEFGVSFEGVAASDIAAQAPVFAWLDVLRAPISGAVRSGIEPSGRFAPLNATLQIGAGVVQPNNQTTPIPFDGARSYFSYDPADQVLQFDEVSVQSKWITGLASGSAVLGTAGKGGPLTDLVGQFNLRDLVASPRSFYADPVTLEEADVDFQLSLNPFRVQLGRLQISDQGQTLLVDGELAAEPAGWRIALNGWMDGIRPERILSLWPEGIGFKTRKWLTENLIEGTLQDIDVALRRTPDAAPEVYLAFDYQDASVRFMKTMPPVTQGRGHMSIVDKRLVVSLDSGQVVAPQGGAVTLAGSSFIMPDITVKDGPPAVIRLETRSTVTATLALLDVEPMRVMQKAKLPIDLMNGRAAMEGTIALPLKKGTKPDAINYHFTGDLTAVKTEKLIKGRRLTASKIAVNVDNRALNLSGAAQLDGVDVKGAWAQPIGPGASKSRLEGQLALGPDALEAFNISLPPGTIAGAGTADITLDLQKGSVPRFALSSNLRGLKVAVPQLSWVKPAASAGKFELSGTLGPVPQVERLHVEGAGLSATGSVSLGEGGTMERLRFDRVRLGDWLDVPVDLVGQGKGRPVQVVLRGGALDLRRAEFGKSKPTGQKTPPMQVTLDQLRITDTIALTGLRGNFDTARGLDGSFEARINGTVPVQGRVLPQNGRSAVQLLSSDAGGVLRGAGLLNQVAGGQLSLILLPVGTGGAFDGLLTVGDVAVKDAPGIAALVNAVSVVGLVNELNGDGIYFDEVEAKFRLTPNRLTLTEASAVGASLGLSMDGVYALDSGMIDMQGVISPVYLLNGIGSVLTRKGEGLIGFNYGLTGPAKSPSVSINPLSALTPGMFRDIFRRPPPKLPNVEGAAPAPTSPTLATRPPSNSPQTTAPAPSTAPTTAPAVSQPAPTPATPFDFEGR